MVSRLLVMTLLAVVMVGVASAQTQMMTSREDAAKQPEAVTRTPTEISSIDSDAPASPSADTAAADASDGNPPADSTTVPDVPQARLKGYRRPDQKTKLVNYLFDAYGPFPLVGSALVAGINQADGSVREWGGGIGGYGRHWGSNYGIGATTTTARFGMAEMLHEDTLYYRCQCSGFFPRLGHALLSTFTGRRGDDGHRVFSVPSLVAPYVGEMVAVYGWYPGRYDAKDAFRQGNYSLLAYAGGNVALEFLPSGPHSLLSRMHLQNRHAAPENSN